MRRFLLFIVCLAASVVLSAESLYSFQSLTTADGLSNSMVKCMLIDSEGFLWIGTDMGLNRYDGYEVEPMGSLLGTEWQFSSIDELQEDSEGNVWIDCQHAYLIYHISTRTFDADAPARLKDLGIDVKGQAYKVKVADDGSLWVLQRGMLWHYDGHGRRVRSWKNPLFKVEDLNFYACSATDELLLLAGKQAVWQFSASTGQLVRITLPAEMQREDNIYGSFIDDDHSVWLFSIMDEKICRYSVKGKTVGKMITLPADGTYDSKNNAIRDMMDDGHGNVWIATDHKGIVVYHKATGEMTHIMNVPEGHRPAPSRNQLSSNNVISLAKDRRGTVWAGHYKTGISYTSATPRLFQSKGRQYGDVSTVFCDSQGNIWIGTDGNGLYVEHKDGTSEKTALPNITVSAVAEDNEGTIWVGTYSEGLFRLGPEGRYEQYGLANGKLPTNSVWCVTTDSLGGIWCASAVSPLVRLDRNTGRWQEIKDIEGTDILGTGFCRDKRGRLLIASTYGLFVYEAGKARRYTTNFSGTQEMEPKMATSICYDDSRDILLLGHKQGLTIFDMKHDRFYFVGNRENGRAISIKGIVEDRQGFFWLSTASGISRLEVGERQDGSLGWNVRNYTSRDGLQTPFFNANASALTNDGHVLFGGIEGYTSIYPDETGIVQKTSDAPVIISVMVGDRVIDATDGRITLNHDDTHVVIRFFPGHLNGASSVGYAYRIKGVMDDWVYTEENHITLVGLSPGDYRLQLKVSEGVDTEGRVCELAIHVNRPFYLTGWAFLAYALLCMLIGYLLWLRARRRKQRKLRQEKFVEWAGKSHQDFRKKLEVNPSEVTITPLDEQFLQKAIKLVEDQMGNADLTVEMLGQQLGMSRSFLYKKLMAVTGLGPSEFIRTIRIKRGMALLERSQMQITEIAYAVGFNSLKSFTMNFKAEYGITPSEYLKNTKKQQEKT